MGEENNKIICRIAGFCLLLIFCLSIFISLDVSAANKKTVVKFTLKSDKIYTSP